MKGFTSMKRMIKLKKGPNKCLCCHQIANTTWYRWVDIFINVGKVIQERICYKCAKSIIGKKHLNELD